MLKFRATKPMEQQAQELLRKASRFSTEYRNRRRRCIETIPRFNAEKAWHILTCCLLTSVQRSGITKNGKRTIIERWFKNRKEFPLGYLELKKYTTSASRISYIKTKLKAANARAYNERSKWIDHNFSTLFEKGEYERWLRPLLLQALALRKKCRMKRFSRHIPSSLRKEERDLCQKIGKGPNRKLKGIGPKQTRNFLQSLGLVRYEIPIDSRWLDFLRNNGNFPVIRGALQDWDFYESVLDGIHELSIKVGEFPCLLDSAVFWKDQNEKAAKRSKS